MNETVCQYLNNVTGCYYYLGSKVWPNYPKEGAFILSGILIIIFLLVLRYILLPKKI